MFLCGQCEFLEIENYFLISTYCEKSVYLKISLKISDFFILSTYFVELNNSQFETLYYFVENALGSYEYFFVFQFASGVPDIVYSQRYEGIENQIFFPFRFRA